MNRVLFSLLIILVFIAALFECRSVHAQSVNANVVRLAPTTVPAICNTGDLRVDANALNTLKICRSNVWVSFLDTGTGFVSPMTTNGDLITQAAGVPARVAIGGTDTVLRSTGSAVGWGKILNANLDTAAAINYSKMEPLTASRVLVSDAGGILAPSVITSTSLGFLDATSSIQGQLDGKQATGNYIVANTGAIVDADVNASAAIGVSKLAAQTANRVAVFGSGGFLEPHSVTIGTLSFVDFTSSGQTQLNAKANSASPSFTGPVGIAGTVTSGTWNGNVITSAYGGVGTGTTSGQMLVWNGSTHVFRFTPPQADYVTLSAHTAAFSANGSGTWTPPPGCLWYRVRMWGAGGGACGTGTGTGGSAGTSGTNTTFGSLTASGGQGGQLYTAQTMSQGGSATGGNVANIRGSNGSNRQSGGVMPGIPGGVGPFGGSSGTSESNGGGGAGAATNSGSGGGTGGLTGSTVTGGSGAAGGYVEHVEACSAGAVSYGVGTGGGGGAAGTGGVGGSDGADGYITTESHFH